MTKRKRKPFGWRPRVGDKFKHRISNRVMLIQKIGYYDDGNYMLISWKYDNQKPNNVGDVCGARSFWAKLKDTDTQKEWKAYYKGERTTKSTFVW